MLENIIGLRKIIVASALAFGLGCGDVESSTTKDNQRNTATYFDAGSYPSSDALIGIDTCLKKTYCKDNDEDGFPVKPCEDFCVQPAGYMPKPEVWVGDCNDDNYDINPAMKEVCNGIDDNCNGQTDEGFPFSIYFKDNDKDGFGDPNQKIKSCIPPSDGVENNKDCNDNNKLINPKGKEICDYLDNNCDGQIDENLTEDCSTKCGSGYKICIEGIWQPCTAPQPSSEICDGLDNNCNGIIDEGLEFKTWYKDNDKDGFGDPQQSLSTCMPPGGYVDNKLDCDDLNPLVNPDMEEICNGIDDDCDGLIDKIINKQQCASYDFIFVIDNSGSMGKEGIFFDTGNDPKGVRYQALHKLVDEGWQSDDQGLIVPFGDSYKIVGEFTSDKGNLHQNIDIAKSYESNGTNIPSAMEAAFSQFQSNNQKRAVIILTDGGSDGNPNELAQQANTNDLEICAIGLGDDDGAYLSTLSSGNYVHINSADDLLTIFQESYLSFKCQSWLECSPSGQFVGKTGGCKK